MLKTWTISNTNNLVAFSTTRKGGVSQGKYGEFNINEYCGDEPEHIAKNRQLLADRLGIAADHIILPHQVHGTEGGRIDGGFFSLSEDQRKERLEGVDAVISDQKGICIGVSTADCIPVLLYDEEHQAAAAIHAGWRGTVARIVEKTLQEMISNYHTHPERVKAVIGPGISLDSFEVGDEVYEIFRQAAFPMEKIAGLRPGTSPELPMKWHINLPLCNKLTLMDCGVEEANIQDCGICTFQHSDEYFSARKLGIRSGRIYTGIVMK